MVENNINHLFQLATTFRRAIMECDNKSFLLTAMQEFPSGACGDASLLLAKYFENNKCGEFQYVLGKKNRQTHAWLEQGSVIADITADQFENQNSPIIVTTNHLWHSQFSGEIQNVANYEKYDPNTAYMLETDYYRIIDNINKT